jgi:heat shock protein HslJ
MRPKTVNNISPLAFLCFFLMIASCSGEKNKDDRIVNEKGEKIEASKKLSDKHTSKNALDWTGIYTGIIPCTKCEGIETRISLLKNGSYQKSSVYLEKDNRSFNETGQVEWNENEFIITLVSESGESSVYKVGEGFLQMLDKQGKDITGDVENRYLLVKNHSDARIEDKKWILVEMMGQVFDDEKASKVPTILLNSALGIVSGNNGCNSFSGTYKLPGNNRIEFSSLGVTRMACPEQVMEQARKFNEALGKADIYKVDHNELSLHKGKMAELARFELR